MRKIFSFVVLFLLVVSVYSQTQKSINKTTPQNNLGQTIDNQKGLAPHVQILKQQTDQKQDLIVGTVDKNPAPAFYNHQNQKNDITIGTGTELQRYPIYAYYGYSYTQSIYLASEIGANGNITKIKYYFAGTSLSSSNNWTIYMGHTTKTAIASATDWTPIGDLTQVYSHEFTAPTAPGWIEFTLDQPFLYNGTDNLVIAVDENKAGYNTSDDKFHSSTVTDKRSMVAFSDSNNPDPSNPPQTFYFETFIPNIIISIFSTNPVAYDFAVTSILDIPSLINSGTTITPKVKITNEGANTDSIFDVTLTIKNAANDTVYSDTINHIAGSHDSIVFMNSLIDTFPNWTPAEGNYTITATVALSGDLDNTNDTNTLSTTVTNFILMQNGSDSTCDGIFFDTGGLNGAYQNNEDLTFTINPGTPGNYVKVEFTAFETENNYDSLKIYDANNTNSGYIGKFMGTVSPGTIKAHNSTGALTFKFKSDGSAKRSGWAANVSCFVPPAHDLGITSVEPQYVNFGSTIQPQVTLSNNGLNAENSYTLNYTNKDGSYSGSAPFTTSIASMTSATVNLPDWTPALGIDTLTVTVVLTNDEDATNDIYLKEIHTIKYIDAYAWDAYVVSSGLSAGPINIELPMGTLSQIASNTTDLIIGADMVNYDWYGILSPASGNSPLVKIDTTTGLYTTIGGGANDLTGFAYNIKTGTAYTIDFTGVLYTIDLQTGSVTSIGGNFANAISLACDTLGNLYSLSLNDSLALINKTTGAYTTLGYIGFNLNYAQSIAYDRDNNALYGTLYNATTGKGGLYSINTTTGAATLLNEFGDEVSGFAIPYTPVGAFITFNVTDNSTPVANANVEVANHILTTDAQGKAVVFLSEDTHSYTITKYGYQTYTNSVTVVDHVNDTVNVVLTASPTYNVTFTVKNSVDSNIVGANVVVIYNNIDTVGNDTTNNQGQYSVALTSGAFKYYISADGYEDSTATFNVNVADTNLTITLKEIITAPYGLMAEKLNNDADVLFSWNNSLGFFDDFERYNDFVLTFGDWTLNDVDGGPTYGMNGITWTNAQAPMAGIIFNPTTTNPPLDPTDIAAHSGNKFVAIFNSSNPTLDDDWIIAPQTTIAQNDVVKFWGRSGTDAGYTAEKLQLFVSTTGTNPSDFTSISPIITTTQTWTEYSADLSAYAGQNVYVAIHCTSADQFFACIDDFYIGQPTKSPKPVQSYTVGLNGNVVANGITETNYIFQDLAAGDYTFIVKAIYETAVSDEAMLNFSITGIEDLSSKVLIYPNPASDFVRITAKDSYTMNIIDINGKVIISKPVVNSATIDIHNLPAGVYILKMFNDNEQMQTKLIKK